MRAWLVLSRGSNLPTVVTNVLAAAGVAQVAWNRDVAVMAVAVSCLYIAGMIFNDVCDITHDRRHRPARPLAAGVITREHAVLAATALTATAWALVSLVSRDWFGVGAAVVLTAVIAYYDVRHKHDPLAPLAMGLCRGLIYVTVAIALSGAVDLAVGIAATVMTVYVTTLTFASRRWSAVGRRVPLLLAVICLIDAGLLLAAGHRAVAGLAALGMPLTLLLQRSIPGD
jgi:4-hydroxybenzoate polyprenyltransferase